MMNHDKLEEYRLAKLALVEAKEKELTLRLEICDEMLKGKRTGTHNFVQDGFKIKAVRKLNYSLDQEQIKNLIDEGKLSERELALLRTKYELKLADFKKADDIPNIEDSLTVKPATPELTVILGE